MPYNYNYTEKHFEKYNVDYDALYYELIKNTTLKPYDTYIKEQINNLKNFETKPIAYVSNNKDELYSRRFLIGSVELIINFNITYIKRFLLDFNQPTKSINIKYFGLKNSPILYTSETYDEEHLKSNFPVIIAPFKIFGISEYIVIDGNHRVSAKVQNNFTSVNSRIHKPNKTFEFFFEYDRTLYFFLTSLSNYI